MARHWWTQDVMWTQRHMFQPGGRHLNRVRWSVAVVATLIGIPIVSVLAQDATPVAEHSDIEIAYVLHGLNTFTEEMATGAEDAARDYGVTLETFGDASFDVPAQQAHFEAALRSEWRAYCAKRTT